MFKHGQKGGGPFSEIHRIDTIDTPYHPPLGGLVPTTDCEASLKRFGSHELTNCRTGLLKLPQGIGRQEHLSFTTLLPGLRAPAKDNYSPHSKKVANGKDEPLLLG
jgi:hypothetical protein